MSNGRKFLSDEIGLLPIETRSGGRVTESFYTGEHK